MFVSHRRTGLARLDAWLETHALVHTGYRVHVVRNRNVVSEDALSMRAFERKGAVGRPIVTVVLGGHARLDVDGKRVWLGAGDVSLVPSKGQIVMRQSRAGEPYESFVVEWEPPTLGAPRPADFVLRKLAPEALEGVRAAAAAIVEAHGDEAAASLRSALHHLRNAELPFGELAERDLIEPVAEQTRKLAGALDKLLSDMRRRPMVVDLDATLGLSARQINRLVTAFNEKYGFNSRGWLDTRSRRRVMMGAALMSARGAETEEVSAAVGYGSPAAFCRALAEAGLPTPGAIGKTVEELL